MLRNQHRFFRSVLIACDTLMLVAAVVLAYFVRFHLLDEYLPPKDSNIRFATHSIPVLVAVPLMLVSLLFVGLYQPRRDQRYFYEASVIIKATLIGLGLTIAFITLFGKVLFDGRDFSRLQYGTYFVLSTFVLLLWRYAFRVILRSLRRRGWNLRHVAIIGDGRLGQVVAHTLKRNSWTGIKPSFFISHHAAPKRQQCVDLPVRGGINDLETILDTEEISGVFIALPGRMAAELPDLLLQLEKHPLDVRVIPDMNPKYMPINMSVSELEGMPILSVRESPLAGWGHVVKRVIDFFGSIVALVIFGLPMIIIAILTRFSGSGPVIFRQERMSVNGQRFMIYKFRTMHHVDSEAMTLRDSGQGKAAWTKTDDVRVTRLGRLLRRTSLDELPQLFNVLIGEMSLVGPRPERPELIQKFREDWRGYMLRQNVKAGMTGWAQINGLRGNTSLRKRLQYDLFYIRNWSVMFDLRILWLTIFKGFVHPNAN
ncbi:MAG: undecaprenyl-phosphate glucose phosphotransferase [Planctomycetota bacterium]|nr:undecaprenyl-phosphate glucose phosphotransferase [Planctomycetota bacterium]